jgi:demethoxyubiquinone hydroxylase (CLK1/Coq7/Cat5 family)
MGFLHSYRGRAEVLQAETNRDLLRFIAGHEEQDAARFATPLTAKAEKNAKS